MKLQFKHQKFQADAAKAVVDVFKGQPYLTPNYMIDTGKGKVYATYGGDEDFIGWSNSTLISELSDNIILENLRKVQRTYGIAPSDKLIARETREDPINLTIEMETGVGKTYTYIKTMYELNREYGWCKYIIVVPSIAIREGVYKSFQLTQDHFAEVYGKKINFFIYSSSRLTEIDNFASDSGINAMIINSQAFNATGKDARRIDMELDEFRSRKPIDVIANTHPILIIDEPQSVEGPKTKKRLRDFKPIITLRYSATHKKDSIYNMVYRLDAIDAYNKRLVKKIAVKGITESGTTATDSYLYLEKINLSESDPTATIQLDVKQATCTKRKSIIVKEGYDLYDYSNELEEYRNFVVTNIDGRENCVEFMNGVKLYAGDVYGKVEEDQLRRIQIRETILSHIERERQLFSKGIKVLSLFFIDEVSNYRIYDENDQEQNGKYAQMFEEEYNDILSSFQIHHGEDEYIRYLTSISAHETHKGYFSIDKKGHITNGKLNRDETSDDVSAYELIMQNKELLLDRNPKRSPVRFIFSHSALKEGWDNPNVFQICTLKQSSSEVRKRQEVGRGLRLCVNQSGERMDSNVLGNDVHNVNVLTIIASESYDSFARGLQSEIAEAVADRPKAVTVDLFKGKVITDTEGNTQVITLDMADAIQYELIRCGYIDRKGVLTDRYFDDKANGTVMIAEEAAGFEAAVIDIIDSVYSEHSIKLEDARENNVELHVDEEKFAMPEFQALWENINAKSVYTVNFDSDELIKNSVIALDGSLHVSKLFFKIESGEMDEIKSKEELQSGIAFSKGSTASVKAQAGANSSIKYDLIGKLVEGTGLTRHDIIAILQCIQESTFNQFADNPEDFIIKATSIINEQKATAIIEHITYDVLDERYGKEVFTDPTIKGTLGKNAMKAKKHLYDHIVYDSTNEHDFAQELDTSNEVAVYVKLPDGFYISTPIGKYNPDWAIAFYEGNVKHIYFVAETKGSMKSMELRLAEQSKIHCAREHFKAISSDKVVYDVVDSYKALLDIVMK